MTATEVVASVLMLLGVGLAITAGIGMLRFPGFFARAHSATKPVTLGLVLILTGTALLVDRPGDGVKLLLVLVLQFVTVPVGAHMVGRAAYRAGTELNPDTVVDELAGTPTEDSDLPPPLA